MHSFKSSPRQITMILEKCHKNNEIMALHHLTDMYLKR